MKAKVIHTEVKQNGIIHIEDHDLTPGKVDIIVLIREQALVHKYHKKVLPLGGYKVGRLSPDQLSRKAMYEEQL